MGVYCATCNVPLSEAQLAAGNGEFCDDECARCYPMLPEGRSEYQVKPGDLANEARRQVRPDDLVRWYRRVWLDEWRELGWEKPVPPAVQLSAAAWLTERGYGKAPQYAPVEGTDPMGLTDADREIAALEDELARLREKKLRQQAEGTDVAAAGAAGTVTA